MDELIRKQDALDAIHCDITVTGRQNAELVAATIGAFADRIKALPAVQPEKCTEERTKTHACDCISRQAAIDAAKHAWAKGLEPSQYIELLPSAQPEMTDEQFKDYCRKRCLSVVTNEFMEDVRKMVPTVRPIITRSIGELIGYTGEPCPNCGRLRVERYESGLEICEKCNWCEQTKSYWLNWEER